MRIISGKYKHRHFEIPHSFKARPTTDFAKEGLFNILCNGYVDFNTTPSALDLFAGTGSISLELLSRGCSRVVSVEQDTQHFRFLIQMVQSLHDSAWTPLRADVFRYLMKPRERFNIVFADPPYALNRIPELPNLVLHNGILTENGIFVLEHGNDHDFSTHPCFVEHRTYGAVNFSFFRYGCIPVSDA